MAEFIDAPNETVFKLETTPLKFGPGANGPRLEQIVRASRRLWD